MHVSFNFKEPAFVVSVFWNDFYWKWYLVSWSRLCHKFMYQNIHVTKVIWQPCPLWEPSP